MALRVRGETVDEITGAASTMRAKMTEGGRAAGRHRRGRHRRRRLRLLQRLDLRGADRRRRRRAGRQARQPGAVVEVGRGRRARRARRQDRAAPGRDHPLHLRGRHRLHVRAGAPSGDQERRADPRRARHPHDLQSARPAVQSGRRQAPDDRRVLAAMDRADGAGVEAARLRMRLGGAWLRRARRDHHVRPDPYRGAGERHGPHLRDQSGGHRPRAGQAGGAQGRRRRRPTPRR